MSRAKLPSSIQPSPGYPGGEIASFITATHAAPWIIGTIKTTAGDVPVVDTRLRRSDMLGSWAARWGIRRKKYRVGPGLYAAGSPNEKSPVFVTANYKMSFDRLRSQLGGIDGWILVLDTKGINVWCAAGKGTFCTDEIGRRASSVSLKKIIVHRTLIVPQLGAAGVSAQAAKKRYGFKVIFGPIRASDIKAFLQAGMTATPEMRHVTFTLSERLVLVPIEIVINLKYGLLASAVLLLLSGLGPGTYSFDRAVANGITSALLPTLAVVAGATLPAILLPWLPGRAFSVKGAWAGLFPIIGVALLAWLQPQLFHNWESAASWFFLIPAVTSFIGMNFTGSSTYTSLSGVKREMRIAVPAQISCAVVGLGLWIAGLCQ